MFEYLCKITIFMQNLYILILKSKIKESVNDNSTH